MKKLINTLIMVCFVVGIIAQNNLEVEGKAVISVMEEDQNTDSIVVWQSDGTLAVRGISSLNEDQILSLSNDTVYLTNGGFIVLMDTDTSNELQTISRTGLDVTLSNDGGTFKDSVNVYSAGIGIDITDNVVSATGLSTSPWYLGKDTLGGIVYYIYIGSDGQEHGLIVSKIESTSQWQSVADTTNANRSWDGMYNMNLMTNSPAKNWVTTNFTNEWYLPSIDELSILWHNRFHTNKALFDGGHTLLSKTTLYWSSTEDDTAYAWYLNFIFGGAASFDKTTTRSVRAIRAF